MPLLIDKKALAGAKDLQSSCASCEKLPLRNEAIISCDICETWTCRDCCSINEKLIEAATKTNSKLNYVCESCTSDVPKIRNLMKIQQRQERMEQNLKEIQETVEVHTTAIQENGNNIADHEERIKSIEKVIKDNKLAEYSGEFPPLVNFAEKLTSQEQNTTKLNKTIQQQAEDKEEETRKASKALNLIIYGIPENETDEVHQMKQDFIMIKQVYENKVTIDTTDITQIIRIGKKSEGKTRPIKITCVNAEIKKEILTNNKFLRIEGEQYEMCECRTNPGKHLHVNVTTDKTKKEREDESILIQELKTRRAAGENVLIKKGKIVNRVQQRKAFARWAEVCQDV